MKITDLPAAVRKQAAHILDKLAGIELPEPTGYYVLLVQWRKPERIGSIIVAGQTHDEDKYQGRSGLVLALGPDAYKGDRYLSGAWVKPGDWAAWPALENAANRMSYAGVVLTVIPDDKLVMRGIDPALVA